MARGTRSGNTAEETRESEKWSKAVEGGQDERKTKRKKKKKKK